MIFNVTMRNPLSGKLETCVAEAADFQDLKRVFFWKLVAGYRIIFTEEVYDLLTVQS